MKAMTYESPSGEIVAKPSLASLQDVIFRERNKYWRCGSGDSSLGVTNVKRRKDGTHEMTILPTEPSLVFWLVEKHGFFFVYFGARDPKKKTLDVSQYVPFAGGESDPWVKHYVGGDTFYAPRGCFVSRPFASEIVKEFMRSQSRSKAVRWVNRHSLEFPNPSAGDTIPSRSKLA